MQIEGTPNERALLVVFAYVAGFTASFILFGNVGSESRIITTTSIPATPTQTATVLDSVPVADAPSAPATPSAQVSTVEVRYENNGLYVFTEAEFPILLSKEAAAAGVVYDTETPLTDTQGFHTAIPHYEFIEAFDHVFFCEQHASTGECTPFLYDLNTQTLHVFQTVDGPFTVTTNEARLVTVTSAGSYVLGQYRSAQPNRPWEMVLR